MAQQYPQKPMYPLQQQQQQPQPQWQLNPYNNGTSVPSQNPHMNGNGSNYSSRTASPAQPPASFPSKASAHIPVSGLVNNMQTMSLGSTGVASPPNVPVNGNGNPSAAAGLVNGNHHHNLYSKPGTPTTTGTPNFLGPPHLPPPAHNHQPQQPQHGYAPPPSSQTTPMTNNFRPPMPASQIPLTQNVPPPTSNQQPAAFQPVPLPPIQQSQIPGPQNSVYGMPQRPQQQQQQQPPLPPVPMPNFNAPCQPSPPRPMQQPPRPMYPSPQAGTPAASQAPPHLNQRPQVQSPLLQHPHQQQQQQHQQQHQQHFNGHQQHDGGKLQYQPQHMAPAPPQQQQATYPAAGGGGGGVTQMGFNRLWGHDTVDLMQNRRVLPPNKIEPPAVKLNHQFHEAVNCSSEIFRCTLNKVPESNNLLQKSRLPLGILIHPFRDLNNLPVITSSSIVRCRVCRTYINPFVYFVDSKKWKCNLCYRVNDLPDEFLFDPVSKTYGDPTRRPEVKSSTIEFIAPSEYTLRPPQPAIFLFLLDVSSIAQQSGYLQIVCDTIVAHLDKLPGDTRKQIGFIAYNSAVHFYNIAENFNQPHEVTVLDLDDIFLPFPDNLVVNLKICKDLIKDLLQQLPKRFENQHDPHSSLGAALQAAYKLLSPTGGRITIIQTCLPNHGPGLLQAREDPNNRSSKDIQHLGPATDFYKRLALDCSGQQIAVDLFLLNSQYSDLATLSGISKFSGGCIHHFPLFNANKPNMVKSFRQCFERYLTRKIGFEAVMRVRCTRGLQIHTFHGNFFVRSTDLLSLPNINPDAGFGLQISYEESLIDIKTVCFQAALLYTSSNGERRIRVHTLCLPVTGSLSEVILAADVQCIIGLLTKMAVDRSIASNLSDARDAFINATVDILGAYKLAQNLPANSSGLLAPHNLTLLPLYVLALLKHTAFRIGTSTRLDDRVFAMCEMKTLPLDHLIKYIYPDFYCLDCLFTQREGSEGNDSITQPSKLQLSSEFLDTRSIFLLDGGTYIILYIGSNVQPAVLQSVLGVSSISEVPEVCFSLPEIKTPENGTLLAFIDQVNEDKPYAPLIQIIRDSQATRPLLTEKFVDDRNDSSLSYYEFLQHIKTQIK